ncbi:uncharacterized protein LOC124454990 [Xenia sp. Carnegie-2017]|uniref:uncharacterized protein LOC124454990 n=1 Tax=Xenia sp. Carnegie-2017 TaxID=2897299 RepID=UPI001F03D58B|nr:uncharacterized protein LOC124454990 [Xenia sp. Carnegie-2017]
MTIHGALVGLFALCISWHCVVGFDRVFSTWTKFWWWNVGSKWPASVKDVLQSTYGTCSTKNYCFQRLPSWTQESKTELLAVDSMGTIYLWKFNPANPTAHACWLALHDHKETASKKILNLKTWNPIVIEGRAPKANQDSFMYREQNGLKSLLLDDDNCDCLSSLSLGHGMCGSGHNSKFGKEIGVDALYDPGCNGPRPTIGLSLYFRQEKKIFLSDFGGDWEAFWWWTPGAPWPVHVKDVLQDCYGTCSKYDHYCFQRLPSWTQENQTELLAIDSRGTVYQWSFDSSNPTAHAAWLAFHDHTSGEIKNSKSWNPKTLVGQPPKLNQDSFLYRDAKGYKTVLLDDDNGDHYNTLSMGHALYKQGLGVDYLNDTTHYPSISKGLTLYFRSRGQRNATKYGKSWKGFWWFTSGATWPKSASTDVLAHPYGTCSNSEAFCFQRLPAWAYEDKTELLAMDNADNVYLWHFNSTNPTSHAAWRAFHDHTETGVGVVKNSHPWNPKILKGKSNNINQDSFMYRLQEKTKSILLDDDNCDCLSTLNIGTSMCGGNSGIPKGLGVDKLYDPTCGVPQTSNGLSLYYRTEMSFVDFGMEWTPFWWWTKDISWNKTEKDVLAYEYGHCKKEDSYCFQRLPKWTMEDFTHLLAVDSAGTKYLWKFEAKNPTSHAAWLAFHDHKVTMVGKIKNNKAWNPQVMNGLKPKKDQDSFMYREQQGVKSLLLDDDNCDCLSSLSLGHGMCHSGFSTSFGPINRFGVEELYDENCNTPRPTVGLVLYFAASRPMSLCMYGGDWLAFWWWSANAKWPSNENDVLGYAYGTCSPRDHYCFGRLPQWAQEDLTELLGVDSAGNVYKWKFDSKNPTAHAVWQAFHDHQQTPAGKILNNKSWNPKVLSGKKPKVDQDSFMYRKQNGMKSILLDDDNCDCYTTLNIGHGMCKSSHDTTYGPQNQYGVDTLFDNLCQVPQPDNGLTLYFRTT